MCDQVIFKEFRPTDDEVRYVHRAVTRVMESMPLENWSRTLLEKNGDRFACTITALSQDRGTIKVLAIAETAEAAAEVATRQLEHELYGSRGLTRVSFARSKSSVV